jgi:hypothetical protein
MSLSTEQVVNALVQMTGYPSTLNPIVETLAVKVPITFSNVQNLNSVTGTFTPANNQLNILVFSDGESGIAPNFVVVFCDAQLNLTINQNNNSDAVFDAPVQKCLMLLLPELANGWISQVQVNGLTSANNPMPQTQAVNYTIIYGQATIS